MCLVWGSGFRVWLLGLGFRVVLVFMVQSLQFSCLVGLLGSRVLGVYRVFGGLRRTSSSFTHP